MAFKNSNRSNVDGAGTEVQNPLGLGNRACNKGPQGKRTRSGPQWREEAEDGKIKSNVILGVPSRTQTLQGEHQECVVVVVVVLTLITNSEDATIKNTKGNEVARRSTIKNTKGNEVAGRSRARATWVPC
jgi:hypothetical protein